MKKRLRLSVHRNIDTGIERLGKAKVRMHTVERKLAATPTQPLMDLVSKQENSQQLQDPFRPLYGMSVESYSTIIEPPHDPGKMILAALGSSCLRQCIDAYVVNIESYGFQLEYIGKQGTENEPLAQSQKLDALAFCDSPNGDRSLREIRETSRADMEFTGARYWEFGRDLAGRITFMDQIPSPTMRMTRKDREATDYEIIVPNDDGSGYTTRQAKKYFRRYVQIGALNQKVFFKEFGDPRSIDPKTGKVDPTLPVEEQATEVYQQCIYTPGCPYGLPRWFGSLKAILGAQESELVNLNFFRENAIPAMAVLISGGALTGESFDNISNIINAARGKDAMNRILILEAAADESGSVDQAPPAPKIELKPMISERQQDGLFKEFEQEAKKKIRSTMRLPAIYTGDSEEYTKATAQAGQRIAESQVFNPERTLFDDFINTKVFPTLGVYLWRFKSMGPTVYDPESLGTLVDRFARHGSLTPNILIKLANGVLDVQVPTIEDKWGDLPYSYVVEMLKQGHVIEGLEEAFAPIVDASVNNQTNPNLPTNDNQVAAFAQKIVRELRSVSNELVTAVNEAIEHQAAVAEAA